jgi:site-specific recombinase XerD
MTIGKTPTFDESVTAYLRTLAGANKSASSITAFRADRAQFVAFLQETNCTIASPVGVTRVDLAEYLAHLAECDISCTTSAREFPAALLGNAASRLCRW